MVTNNSSISETSELFVMNSVRVHPEPGRIFRAGVSQVVYSIVKTVLTLGIQHSHRGSSQHSKGQLENLTGAFTSVKIYAPKIGALTPLHVSLAKTSHMAFL